MSAGKPLAHDAAPLHVTGAARYIDDIPLPSGALHLAFGLSTCASGVITALDLAAVRSAPGVVAVFAAEDFPDMPDCSPSIGDEPLLATGEVHYIGQAVFLVVADSHLAARKAARLGKISYAERPARRRWIRHWPPTAILKAGRWCGQTAMRRRRLRARPM